MFTIELNSVLQGLVKTSRFVGVFIYISFGVLDAKLILWCNLESKSYQQFKIKRSHIKI